MRNDFRWAIQMFDGWFLGIGVSPTLDRLGILILYVNQEETTPYVCANLPRG